MFSKIKIIYIKGYSKTNNKIRNLILNCKMSVCWSCIAVSSYTKNIDTQVQIYNMFIGNSKLAQFNNNNYGYCIIQIIVRVQILGYTNSPWLHKIQCLPAR